MDDAEQAKVRESLSVRNAQALASDIGDVRERVYALEETVARMSRQIATQNALIQKQSKYIGTSMAKAMGTGSTVADGNHS